MPPHHGVRLARPSRPVREHRRVVAIEHVLNERLRCGVVNFLLKKGEAGVKDLTIMIPEDRDFPYIP